jgi:hypothetical protein
MKKYPATLLAAVLVIGALAARARGAEALVTVADDGASFTLANGHVTAQVSKRTGDLVSFKYKDVEMLGSSGHAGGYWSHTPAGMRTTAAITIDPKTNAGARGEVSVKAISAAPRSATDRAAARSPTLRFATLSVAATPASTLIRSSRIRPSIPPRRSAKRASVPSSAARSSTS